MLISEQAYAEIYLFVKTLVERRAHVAIRQGGTDPREFTGRLVGIAPFSNQIELSVRPDPAFSTLGTVIKCEVFSPSTRPLIEIKEVS